MKRVKSKDELQVVEIVMTKESAEHRVVATSKRILPWLRNNPLVAPAGI